MGKGRIMKEFYTTGSIASKLGVDRDAVTYAIRKAKIAPLGKLGGYGVYGKKEFELVRSFLEAKPKHYGGRPKQ